MHYELLHLHSQYSEMFRFSSLLALGDVLAILLFTVVGRSSHHMPVDLGAAGATLSTAAPFLLGWLLATPWLGGYRPPAWRSPTSALVTLLKVFIPGLLAGILLRAVALGRFSPLIFYLVTAAGIMAVLITWRLTFTLLIAPRLASPAKS